ncbi:substrate-binding domain-containing protein [Halomonas litopenaei]|uniref:substrate-binding domain-containing protein n=1 Tax=Halomonas litopenaei TaxID=2109328 RepID=UPI003FA16D71
MVEPVLPRYLTTAEVADYLRLKPRKVYDLVRQGQIPCTRATGKLLFPRHAIDLWLMNHLEGDQSSATEPLEVMAGSQDPLLDWAMRESGCGLASLCLGSGDGIQRLLAGKAMVVGAHLLDGAGRYNVPSELGLGGMRDLVVVHWARRTQGLMLAPGNPLGVEGLSDLARAGLRIGRRPEGAGAHRLLGWLLERQGIEIDQLDMMEHPATSEDDLALAVSQGRADVGLGVEAAARRQGLHFLPLHQESFDLLLRRRSYFCDALQRLFAFARAERLRDQAESLGGYDVSRIGTIRFNA